MKKIIIALTVVIIACITAFLIWQTFKTRIIKDLIVNSVSKFTDSLYTLQYDSSLVDEINGNAFFQNIIIKSDSLQLHKLQSAGNLPDILIKIKVKSIYATGLNIALAINEKKIVADKIIITEPLITIIHTGSKHFKKEDSMALFKKILGNYNSIHAAHIEIINAKLVDKNSSESVNTELSKLNISLTNIVIDSTKDYKNVISYLIHSLNAHVEHIYINQPNSNSAMIIQNASFNALDKKIEIVKLFTVEEGKNEERFILNKVTLEELNIEEYINENTISVGNISTGECMLTLFLNQKDSNKKNIGKFRNFDFPDDYFNKIKIGGISIGKSTLIIKRRNDPKNPALRINGFTFHLSKKMSINERSNLRTILDNAKWDMQADDFAIKSRDNNYNLSFNKLKVDKASSSASIGSFKVKPTASEKAITGKSAYQQDIYNIELNNIKLKGVDINKFINDFALNIQEVAMHLNLKVYHDRGPDLNPKSKIGKYPHQLLAKIGIPLHINKTILSNSTASYRERSKETGEIGNIFFTNIDGMIANLTNNPTFIKRNPTCEVKGSGLLLAKTKCHTNWRLSLNSDRGEFAIEGQLGPMNFFALNPLTKPLALTSIDGQLHSLSIKMSGNDFGASGSLTLLYNNLKLETYKIDKETKILKMNKTKSLVSNLLIKNNNPSGGNTRQANFSVQRDIHKSFFNLIWKGVYDGIQNTILNKKVAEIKKQIKETK